MAEKTKKTKKNNRREFKRRSISLKNEEKKSWVAIISMFDIDVSVCDQKKHIDRLIINLP